MNTKTYGCRGSFPVHKPGSSKYGGNTSCLFVKSGGQSLVVDAGSGLMTAEFEPGTVDVLVSHLHLDHVIGLSTLTSILDKDSKIRVYTRSRGDSPLNEQVLGVFKPPYWPVDMSASPRFEYIAIPKNKPFEIGLFTITPFLANHPNESYSFHITDGKKTLVHLLDSETQGMSRREYSELADFCRGSDLVVFDAGYSPEDYPRYKGWGHSSVPDGVALADICRPRRMMFAHFSQFYSDADIDGWARYIENVPGCEFIFARDGMELSL